MSSSPSLSLRHHRHHRNHYHHYHHFYHHHHYRHYHHHYYLLLFTGYYLPFNIYRITKIVRALWLAERSVCMRVCKHGSGVKVFCFSRVNHASTNFKKFSSSKLDKFSLFAHSFVGWNLENRCKKSVSIFRLSWHFKREKSICWKASFCKTRTDYACKTSWTRLCNW